MAATGLLLQDLITLPVEIQFVTDRGHLRSVCGIVTEAYGAKKQRVQVVPWDEKTSKWRYELCSPGAK